MKTVICLLAAATLLCGCKPATPVLTEQEKSYNEAQRIAFEEITNEVVGLRSIISSYVTVFGTNCADWKAGATVEFFNQNGGVERKELSFVFELRKYDWATQQFLACHLDYKKKLAQDTADFQRRLDQAGKVISQ